MIALKELKLINFRSWKLLHIKDFDKKGLCLISGANGSGKSSIRMAIEYLILDKTSDGISVEDMPRDTTESCELFGRFDIDGKEVKITKYRNHTQLANQTHVEYDGDTNLTTNDRRITQKNIEILFDVTPPLLFTSTIFTVNSPSFVESLEADRKKLLYNILPLDVYNELYLAATGKTKLIKNKIDRALSDIEYHKQSLVSINDEMYELKEKGLHYREVIKGEISQLRDQQDMCMPDVYDDTENVITTLHSQIVKVDNDFFDTVRSKIDRVQTNISKLNSDRRYIMLKLNDITDGTCPILNISCKDLVNDALEIAKKYEPDLNDIDTEVDTLKKKLEVMHGDLNSIDATMQANTNIVNQIRLAERQLEDIKRTNKQRKARYIDLEDRIFELGNKPNPYTELVEQKEKDFKDLESKLLAIGESVKAYAEDIEYYLYFEKAFSKAGIPNMKADGFLESIESETNRYLSAVSDRMFVEVKGQTAVGSNLREKIDYSVKHPEKSITNYKSFSGGERQRVKVADLFAFHSLISKFNFIFLDEVLEGSIDTKGKVEVLSLLRMKAKEVDSLLVVSHDDTIKDAFDNVMEVKNINGISTLE